MDSDTSRAFSPSKLGTYQDCPRRYRFRYVDKIKRDTQSVEAYCGSCVHEALEDLYEQLLHGRLMSEDELLRTFDAAWEKGWSDLIQIRKAQYSREDWKNVGRQCLRSYYQEQKPFTQDKTVAIEKKIGFPLQVGEETYRIEGFMDRLSLGSDGAFEIHDYKTGASLPTQQDLDEDWQLAIYDAAVRHSWPDTKQVRLVWHYVRSGKTLVSERSVEELEALKKDIAALIVTIKRDHEFVPHESALCGWCEYRDICPLWKHAEETAHKSPEALRHDDGVRLVDELAAIDAKKRELKVKLKELEQDEEAHEAAILRFAEEKGLLAVHGQEGDVTISEKEEYKFPTKTNAPEALTALEQELKESPLWKEVSHLDAHRLLDGYKRKDWPQATLAFVADILGRYAKYSREKILRFRRRKDTDQD